MFPVPSEVAISGVYLPPLLVAAALGVFAALGTARLLNRYRLSRFVANPPLAFLAMIVIYTVVLGSAFVGI